MGLLTDRFTRDMPDGYTRRFAETSEGMYWHLYHAGEKVNGGLSPYGPEARDHACTAAWAHHFEHCGERRLTYENAWDVSEYIGLLRRDPDGLCRPENVRLG